MNRVALTGRITKDVELRYTQSGVPAASFTLAVDRGFKDANGERQTDFINCVAWRQQAEFMGNYIKKGYMLAVEGQIQVRNFQDQQGVIKYVTEVVADRVENLTPRETTTPQEQEYKPNNNWDDPTFPF